MSFKPPAQASLRPTARPQPEQLADHRSANGVRTQAAGARALIADRRKAPAIAAALDHLHVRDRKAGSDAVKLKLGHREHDPQNQSPGVRAGVEAVLHRKEVPARVADALDHEQPVDQRPSEPIYLPDRQAVRDAGLDSPDCRLEKRPVSAPARLV